MNKDIDNWSSAKGYSFNNQEFAGGVFSLIISFFIIYLILSMPKDPYSVLLILPVGMLLILFIVFFARALRDIPRQNNWIYREYPTNKELYKEMEKDQLIRTIRNHLKIRNINFQRFHTREDFQLN